MFDPILIPLVMVAVFIISMIYAYNIKRFSVQSNIPSDQRLRDVELRIRHLNSSITSEREKLNQAYNIISEQSNDIKKLNARLKEYEDKNSATLDTLEKVIKL